MRRALTVLFFFLSGFSALIYQVIWQRMLGLFSGSDVYSATLIVSAFMLGMGCGSLAGGHLADRLTVRRCLLAFAFAELAIGLFALASKGVYYDFLYHELSSLPLSLGARSALLFASLLLPTFCMGATLPLLSRALTRQLSEASVNIAALYGLNTLGAALGAVVTGLFLIRHFGYETSLKVGACLNFAAMLGAFALAWRPTTTHADIPAQEHHGDTEHRFAFRTWALIYALSGFIALGLEIVWFRVLGVMLKSTAFTFSIVLSIYLLGLALGTFLGLLAAVRSRHPLRIFLLLQSGIGIYALSSITVFAAAVDHWSVLAPVWTYLGSTMNFPFAFNRETLTPEFVWMYGILTPLLILPPTLLMGASFPFLQKAVQTNLGDLGKRVGTLQTANIIGSTLGAITVGLVLMHFLGTAATLLLLFFLGLTYLILLCFTLQHTRSQVALGGMIALLATAAWWQMPDASQLWAKLHGTTLERSLHAEDNTGLSFIKGNLRETVDAPIDAEIFINGARISQIPYEPIHTALGLVPALLHPAPKDVLVIGLGSGNTLYAAAGAPSTEHVTSIEILGSQIANLSALQAVKPYAGVDTIFNDARFSVHVEDGRSWLMRSERKFDIIEADPLLPNTAYANNLYSREYFELVRSHLKPGGYVANWMPTFRSMLTFNSVFPYTLNIGNWMFIGSNEPIVIDREVALARARSPEVKAYYERIGTNAEALLQTELDKIVEPPQKRWKRNQPQKRLKRKQDINTDFINTDLFPKDEYEKPG